MTYFYDDFYILFKYASGLVHLCFLKQFLYYLIVNLKRFVSNFENTMYI